jgi:2-methylcitrate dehydratase PrpD
MTNRPIDPIEDLIDMAYGLASDDVPEAVLAFQRKRVLDNLACLAAGYQEIGVATAIDLARRWSGCQETIVIGSSERLAAPQAAFVNAIRARALDYCDVLYPGWHPSSIDIPVALAMAELSGSSGREMLDALAVAQDFGQRINYAGQANGEFYRGFEPNVLGLFSGAVIAARLLGLDRDQFYSAVGVAFDTGIGSFQHYQDKALSVRFGQGMVARHAIEAAMMARAGVTGPKRILMGEHGFFNLYAPGAPDMSRLTDGLGQKFHGEEDTCFKLYPHCSVMLALTSELLAAKAENRVPDNIDQATITLKASPTMCMIVGQPYNPVDTPEIDAQFSVRYVTANGLVRGRATPAEFTAAAATDETVVRIAQGIELIEEPSFERFDQCEVEITPPGGEPVKISASFGRGWPENPLTQQDLRDKFLTCCSLSHCNRFKNRANQIISAVEALEEAASVTELIGILSD